MRSLAPRVFLASLLIITVADKIWRARALPMDMRSAVLNFAASNGWAAYEETGAPDSPLGSSITFRADACDASGQIFLVHLSLQAAPMLDHAIPSNHSRRFVYMGRMWLTQDRWSMRLEWLKQRLLSLFGLAHYNMVNETVLVVAEPGGCRVADKVDWSSVWGRRVDSAYLPRGSL